MNLGPQKIAVTMEIGVFADEGTHQMETRRDFRSAETERRTLD